MRPLVAVAATVLLVSPAAAHNVLYAEPTVRIDSGEDRTSRRVLPAVERAKSRVIIIRWGGKYVELGGAGYVKVLDSHEIPEQVRVRGPRYRFTEHVTSGLGSITYWGATDRFSLEP